MKLVPHIKITLRYDEDIGDEWFVVFLLFNLTKIFHGLIARISDSDGEFLLIEAAEELPPWANPETCQDRVFIMNNAVHVIRNKLNNSMNILDSLTQRANIFKMPEKVQAVIQKRISVYPAEIENRRHKARAYLPVNAAHILSKEPDLIAAAIRTIYNSDSLEVNKICQDMLHFSPEKRQMANVKMTKCLFAMATQMKYTEPFHKAWGLHSINNQKYKAYLLGIKIAFGLELLIARALKERGRKEKETEVKNNQNLKFNRHTWTTFLDKLKAIGYFRGLLKGSKDYEKLYLNAEEYFSQNMNVTEVSCRFQTTEDERVLQAWKDIQCNNIELEGKFYLRKSRSN